MILRLNDGSQQYILTTRIDLNTSEVIRMRSSVNFKIRVLTKNETKSRVKMGDENW